MDGNRLGTEKAVSGIEQTDHQLLLRGGVEGFLLRSPPELPHTKIAGAKFEIVLVLVLNFPIHGTSTAKAGEHCQGIKCGATNTRRPRGLAFKYTGWTNRGSALPEV